MINITDRLKYRMYGLVNYQLANTVHAGIQFGHAVVEYGQSVKANETLLKEYNNWADFDKTFIILNGGTTNTDPNCLGTLNKHFQTLVENNVFCSPFYEPDLGNQLTGVAFLVDERVWDRNKYPDYSPYSCYKNYDDFVNEIGGNKNLFLRYWLSNFKLI